MAGLAPVIPTDAQEQQQTATSIMAALVQASIQTPQIVWQTVQSQWDKLWTIQDPVVMNLIYEGFVGQATTYTSLNGTVCTNNWQAMFYQALDAIALIQATNPELLEGLPQFTDGSTMYLSPGWVLDPVTSAPISPKTLLAA